MNIGARTRIIADFAITLLERLDRARHAVLSGDPDYAELAASALAAFHADGQVAPALAELDARWFDAVGCGATESTRSVTQQRPIDITALRAWLMQVRELARAVHPQALTVARLAAEGFDDRAIAERLQLSWRIARRIRADLATASSATENQERAEAERSAYRLEYDATSAGGGRSDPQSMLSVSSVVSHTPDGG